MSGNVNDSKWFPATEWMSAMAPLLEEGFVLKILPSGSSMAPFLWGGRDHAYLSGVGERTLRRGDIVLYARPDGMHVLHRIHHVAPDGYYLLGDSQLWIEGPVPRGSILAVALSYCRKGKDIRCDRPFTKAASLLWMRCRPLRPFILRAYYALRRRTAGTST